MAVMQEIRGTQLVAHAWLGRLEYNDWKRWRFEESVICDHVTNNCSESYNRILKPPRCQSYLELFEFIRKQNMNMIQKRIKDVNDWDRNRTPCVKGKPLKASDLCRQLSCFYAEN